MGVVWIAPLITGPVVEHTEPVVGINFAELHFNRIVGVLSDGQEIEVPAARLRQS